MRRYLLLFGICIFLSAAGQAQHSHGAKPKPEPDGPASKEEVEKYFQVMHISDNMQAMMTAMVNQTHDMVHDEIEKSGAKLPSDFEARMDALMDEMLKQYPVQQLTDAIVPVFQQHFTRNELKAITAFYSTPVGIKLLREQPELTQQSMQISYGLLQQRMEVMREKVQTEIGQSRLDGR
jgi:hypothetical protein